MPKPREDDPRYHRADASEPVQITPEYIANLGQDATGQCARDKGKFRTKARGFLHIGECLHLPLIDEVAPPPEIVPRCSGGWYEVMRNSKRLIKDSVLSMCYPVAHIHVIVIV